MQIQNVNLSCNNNHPKMKNNSPSFGSYFKLSEDLLELAEKKPIISEFKTFPCLQKMSKALKQIIHLHNIRPGHHMENDEKFTLDILKHNKNIYKLVAKAGEDEDVFLGHSIGFDLNEMKTNDEIGVLNYRLQRLITQMQEQINSRTINPKRNYSQKEIDVAVERILNTPGDSEKYHQKKLNEALDQVLLDTNNEQINPKQIYNNEEIDKIVERTMHAKRNY